MGIREGGAPINMPRSGLAKNPRVRLHFTPTSCSWLNLECFFSIITRQPITIDLAVARREHGRTGIDLASASPGVSAIRTAGCRQHEQPTRFCDR